MLDRDEDHQSADPRPLPGAVRLVKGMERRRFLRKTANTLFYGLAATAAGEVGLLTFLTSPAQATGACCAFSCCGPSPCCGTSCCNKDCCGSNATCKNNGSTCLGQDFREYPSSSTGCWSCSACPHSFVCCDCKTNNTSGCSNFTNRCICEETVNFCGAEARNVYAAPKNFAGRQW
jgi:hypothetical protein